jgi:mono/diheme cytochrome c family protein
MRCLTLLAGLLATLVVSAPAGWGGWQPAIEIVLGERTVMLPRSELLQRADLTEIRIPRDPTYRQPMSYRALPLASLLRGLPLKPDEVIEVVATDGFVTLLPPELVFAKDDTASVPYLAIEPADEPWPVIPGKTVSAGPFYVVWLKPELSGVRSEQWPYAVASFRSAEPPARRWPALAVDPKLPANSPVRAGQALFITQCMVCHTLNGAGNAYVGPDLNIPQNPTEYLAPTALPQLIRNPASVRNWPDMKMQGFDQDALSDHEIDLIIQYLAHMAGRKKT